MSLRTYGESRRAYLQARARYARETAPQWTRSTVEVALASMVGAISVIGLLQVTGSHSIPAVLGGSFTVETDDSGHPYPAAVEREPGGEADAERSSGGPTSAVPLFSVATSKGVLSLVGGEGSLGGGDPQPPGPDPLPGPSPAPSPAPSPSPQPTPSPTTTEPPTTTESPKSTKPPKPTKPPKSTKPPPTTTATVTTTASPEPTETTTKTKPPKPYKASVGSV
jgi:hypothetical protein